MRLDQFSFFSLLSVLHRTPEKIFLTWKNEKNRKDETKVGKKKIYIAKHTHTHTHTHIYKENQKH
jgi:hypothetical protein